MKDVRRRQSENSSDWVENWYCQQDISSDILWLNAKPIFHTDIKIKFGGKRMLYLLSKTETRMIDLGDGFFA